MPRPRFVQKLTDRKGRERLYFRRAGSPRVTLPGPIGSRQFEQAYRTALAGGIVIVREVARRTKRRHVPRLGVYFLLLGDELVYIGSSMDMPQRVAQHKTNGRRFDRVFYIETRPGERLGLEAILIRALGPRHNKNGKCKPQVRIVNPVGNTERNQAIEIAES